MAQELAATAQTPFSLGRTLNNSFGVFGRNLVPFLIVTAIISLPYIIVQTWLDYAAAHPDAAGSHSGFQGGTIAMMFVQSITFGLVQAALTYGTVQDLRGQRAGIGECLKLGLARSGNIVSGATQYGFLLGLATLLLIIPGILLYVRWWVFMPAMVVESLTPKEAFERSIMLTSGRRWIIFALGALILVVEFALIVGLIMLFTDHPEAVLLGDILVTLLALVFTAFSSVVAAVGYYHLRVEMEGVLIDDIAKVFD
jgi:hypothetical protein